MQVSYAQTGLPRARAERFPPWWHSGFIVVALQSHRGGTDELPWLHLRPQPSAPFRPCRKVGYLPRAEVLNNFSETFPRKSLAVSAEMPNFAADRAKCPFWNILIKRKKRLLFLSVRTWEIPKVQGLQKWLPRVAWAALSILHLGILRTFIDDGASSSTLQRFTNQTAREELWGRKL